MAPILGGRRGSNAAGTASAAAAAAAAAANNPASSSSSSGHGGTAGSSSGSSNAAAVSSVPPLPANKTSTIRGYYASAQGGSSSGSQMPSSATAIAPVHPPSSYGTGGMPYSPPNRNGASTQNKFMAKTSTAPNTSSSPHSHTNSIPMPTDSAIQGSGYKSIDSSSIGDTSLSPNASPSATSVPSFPTSAQSSVTYFAHGNHSGMLDQQSMNSNFTTNTSSSYLTPNHAINSALSSSLSDTPLREAFARRIRSLAYIKRTLSANQRDRYNPSANQAWLDIVRISRQDLDSIYDSEPMRRRAHRYYLLGCSLASTVELISVGEFARAVLAVINEVEMTADAGDKDKTKMRNFFKSSIRGGTARKSAGSVGLAEFSSTYDGVSVGGPSLSSLGPSGVELIGTHIPFQLDFLQTTITFCDILMEIYCKFTYFLNSSAGGMPQGSMRDIEGLPTSGMNTHENFLSPTGAPIAASSMDAMQKVDAKLRKILAQICKEIDGLARQRIREELGSIDPLMARDIQAMDTNTPTAFGTPQSGTSLGASAHAQDSYPSAVPMTNPSISAGAPIGSMRGSNKLGSIHSSNPNMYAGSAPNLLTAGQSPALNAGGNVH
ncbi:uncharacterized protein FA14DRAFT_160481 [Meira miltonrushii]|uniref:Uncharacterized protein n=1 Tax=Meira miltonrushii TaxID=1280837 RepID=A0A316VIB9_9BASI|nr:uncharacterized protein FA14DRAFT_160481 [Meira miltonrushii]PWN35255.1 hypothetical protein FA14DRAFT_160481 [Meira miltonrushii]